MQYLGQGRVNDELRTNDDCDSGKRGLKELRVQIKRARMQIQTWFQMSDKEASSTRNFKVSKNALLVNKNLLKGLKLLRAVSWFWRLL